MELIPLENSIEAWSNCVHGEGQNFKDANQFMIYFKNYAVETRTFLFKKNDSLKVIVIFSEKTVS